MISNIRYMPIRRRHRSILGDKKLATNYLCEDKRGRDDVEMPKIYYSIKFHTLCYYLISFSNIFPYIFRWRRLMAVTLSDRQM
jgi:hypothetical protein